MNLNNGKDADDLVYINMTFVNNEDYPQPASVTETRSPAILENSSEWLMSVVRFDVDSHAIPINVPLMFEDPITGIKSQTQTRSTIFITYLGITYDQDIIFVPNPGPILPGPIPPSYIPAIFDYQVWYNFVNTALALAFTDAGLVGTAPKFIFNPLTGLVDLYVDQNFIPAAGPNQAYISVNETLYQYLTNFEYNYNIQVYTNKVPFSIAIFRITNDNTVVMPAIGSRQGLPLSLQAAPANLYRTTQLSAGTGSFSSLRSILLTSNLLPFKPEGISTVGPNGGNNSYNTSAIFPILSDFLVPTESKVTDFRVVNEYLPTAQYRYINLVGRNALNTIDIKMFWSDFQGNIYPIFLGANASMSVKMLFQKKKTLLMK